MNIKKIEKILTPFGMIGVLIYLAHTMLGSYLWNEYDPITMDISSLTADSAPNSSLLRVFTLVYGICMIVFAAGMLFRSYRAYNEKLKAGYFVFLGMQVVSLVGYAFFPLSSDISIPSFQNTMHFVITGIVVLSTIAFAFITAFGYLNQEKLKGLGKFVFTIAILITLFGVFNPISMVLDLNILGISERLVIFSLMTLIFGISNYESFTITPYNT